MYREDSQCSHCSDFIVYHVVEIYYYLSFCNTFLFCNKHFQGRWTLKNAYLIKMKRIWKKKKEMFLRDIGKEWEVQNRNVKKVRQEYKLRQKSFGIRQALALFQRRILEAKWLLQVVLSWGKWVELILLHNTVTNQQPLERIFMWMPSISDFLCQEVSVARRQAAEEEPWVLAIECSQTGV